MILLLGLPRQKEYFFLGGSIKHLETVFVVLEDLAQFLVNVFRMPFASQHFQVIEETGDGGSDMQTTLRR
jgi:hypothetical protein